MLSKKTEAEYRKLIAAAKAAAELAYRKLIAAAKAAAELAYRPYSQFNVGAAILTFDGQTYTGCNVENCGYTQTIHAEQTALVKAISEGALRRALERGLTQFDFIRAIAVYAPKGSDPWPCCNCRQTLNEFGLKMDVIGYAGTDDSKVLVKKLGELIPHAFPMEEVLASVYGGKQPVKLELLGMPPQGAKRRSR